MHGEPEKSSGQALMCMGHGEPGKSSGQGNSKICFPDLKCHRISLLVVYMMESKKFIKVSYY